MKGEEGTEVGGVIAVWGRRGRRGKLVEEGGGRRKTETDKSHPASNKSSEQLIM